MNIQELKGKHQGKDAFCLGTAPHLNELNLELLKDKVTIACNQLLHSSDKYNLDYICFQSNKRFDAFKDELDKYAHASYLVPEAVLKENKGIEEKLEGRIIQVDLRFASPEHSKFFSFDLAECVYVEDSLAFEIQLAVWMGCKRIYVLGVDGELVDLDNPYFDESIHLSARQIELNQEYCYPDLENWLMKVKLLLLGHGISIYNAAGEYSSLKSLPKVRFQSATGNYKIAVTSKTFSQDEYLVKELERYFPDAVVNSHNGKLKGQALIDFLADADGVILGTEQFSKDIIESLPYLRYVSKYGVGLNNIDFDAVKQNDVELVYRKGVNSDSVAELTLAFALMLIRRIDQSMVGYRTKKWSKLPGKELSEMTIGIIGYGHVGPVVVDKFAALGAERILVNDLVDTELHPEAEFVTLKYLQHNSDIISLHISGEARNNHYVDSDFLGELKKEAYLINTARGEIVDEAALVDALRQGRLAGAALDVYEQEPDVNSELNSLDNVLTTCHIAGSSNRAIKNMGWAAIEGLLELFDA